jgi:hypothetical protein
VTEVYHVVKTAEEQLHDITRGAGDEWTLCAARHTNSRNHPGRRRTSRAVRLTS